MKRLFPLLAASLLLPLAARAIPCEPGPAPQEAYAIPVRDNWELTGGLPENALLISLQGLANTDAPRVYLEYPKDWHFHDLNPLKDFYAEKYGVRFTELPDPAAALRALGHFARGYVVWDKKVRTSINVAFTAAGVLRAVVVNEDQIPLVEQAGLKKLADFRGLFEGQTDAQIYEWAYDRYWKECSRDYIVWMGGVAGKVMEPGIADFGIAMHCFFTDLSADPKDTVEYAFHKRLLAQMHPAATVMGWHSYAKDSEGQTVTLTSSYGLNVEGLNTLPNASFTSQIAFSPGFTFTNTANVAPGEKLTAQKKVYVCLVQSDSMGIGAWNETVRGEIPYTWQIGVSWLKFDPAALEMFSLTKTPNDYFIGGLSGPGYMYPSVIPPERFKVLAREMNSLMRRLQLRVLEIMDHTDRGVPIGYFDLTKKTVDLYYENYPGLLGFINGYAAAHTYDLRHGQPLMSYDYYLDPNRPAPDATADLDELIHLNPRRPYFMLVHVRESNSIQRVKDILQGLGEPVELVPLDKFLALAATDKTYETRYKDPQPAATAENTDPR